MEQTTPVSHERSVNLSRNRPVSKTFTRAYSRICSQTKGVFRKSRPAQGNDSRIVEYVVQAGGKRLAAGAVVLSAQLGGSQGDDAIVVAPRRNSFICPPDCTTILWIARSASSEADGGDQNSATKVAILLGDFLYVEGFSLLAA